LTSAVTLAQLSPGQRGRIVELQGDDAVAVRLFELGLLPGEIVEVLGLAPLGDPMAVVIRGTRLAVRRSDAARISVLVSTDAPIVTAQSATQPAKAATV
jgi:ferrous iron transport protein A